MERDSVKRKQTDASSPGGDESRKRTTRAKTLATETEATRPISMPQQTRVLSLCLNRILQEPGLTRMAQG